MRPPVLVDPVVAAIAGGIPPLVVAELQEVDPNTGEKLDFIKVASTFEERRFLVLVVLVVRVGAMWVFVLPVRGASGAPVVVNVFAAGVKQATEATIGAVDWW